MKKYIDIKLIKYLAIFYTIGIILNLLKGCYRILNGKSNLTIYELINHFIIIDWVIVLSFMTFISYITKQMFEKWGWNNWKRIIIIHIFFSLFIGYFIFFFAAIFIYLIGDYTLEQAINNLSLDHFMEVVEINFLAYFSMLGIIYAYYYVKKVKSIEIQKTTLAIQLTNTKMQILKSQLQPHFLFNTLNSIHSLMDKEKDKSQKMLLNLSDLLREIIGHNENNLIELQDEISLLEKYLDIIKIRFSEDLNIELNIHTNLDHALIPSMLLQPIIENSIKHGYSKNNIQLKVLIHIFKEGENLVCIIQNNGKPLEHSFDGSVHKGLGIKNTIERLKALYINNYSFEFYNNDNGVTTRIKIPYQLAEATLLID